MKLTRPRNEANRLGNGNRIAPTGAFGNTVVSLASLHNEQVHLLDADYPFRLPVKNQGKRGR
jgi:hypothetical protein